MLRSLLLVVSTVVAANPAFAQQLEPAVANAVANEPTSTLPAERNAATARNVELRKLLQENPTLVRELLLASEDCDEALVSIFCLGPAAVEPLIAALDDEEIRAEAAMALFYACAHEEAPRSKVVKSLIALKEKSGESDVAELLVLVTRLTHPDVRASIRRAAEIQLIGAVGGTASRTCGPGGCYAPTEPQYVPVQPPVVPATSLSTEVVR